MRTQIQLTEAQAEKLREMSAANRESVAAIIRKAIDLFIVYLRQAFPAKRFPHRRLS